MSIPYSEYVEMMGGYIGGKKKRMKAGSIVGGKFRTKEATKKAEAKAEFTKQLLEKGYSLKGINMLWGKEEKKKETTSNTKKYKGKAKEDKKKEILNKAIEITMKDAMYSIEQKMKKASPSEVKKLKEELKELRKGNITKDKIKDIIKSGTKQIIINKEKKTDDIQKPIVEAKKIIKLATAKKPSVAVADISKVIKDVKSMQMENKVNESLDEIKDVDLKNAMKELDVLIEDNSDAGKLKKRIEGLFEKYNNRLKERYYAEMEKETKERMDKVLKEVKDIQPKKEEQEKKEMNKIAENLEEADKMINEVKLDDEVEKEIQEQQQIKDEIKEMGIGSGIKKKIAKLLKKGKGGTYVGGIHVGGKKKRKLTEYNKFVKAMRLKGFGLSEIAKLWREAV